MNSVTHLTEEQIDDYLIGDLPAGLTAHLECCDLCRARVAELGGAISSFKAVTLAWSERQSATMPVRPTGISSRPAPGSRAFWAATAAAALVVGIAIPLAHHRSDRADATLTQHSEAVPSQTFAEQREAQIAEDNQMLQAIDRELGAPSNSPSETFGLELGGHSQHGAHNGSVQN